MSNETFDTAPTPLILPKRVIDGVSLTSPKAAQLVVAVSSKLISAKISFTLVGKGRVPKFQTIAPLVPILPSYRGSE